MKRYGFLARGVARRSRRHDQRAAARRGRRRQQADHGAGRSRERVRLRRPRWRPKARARDSVSDAMRSRRLRIDANNEVQVYILMSAVTDETVRQLTDAGVTIEIQRRRAPPRPGAPAGVAPHRGRAAGRGRRDPAADLRAARAPATRSPKATPSCTPTPRAPSSALDGTGVRVGVVSDGIKGVFATGCTTGCAGVDGGPIATGDLPTATGTRNAAGVLTGVDRRHRRPVVQRQRRSRRAAAGVAGLRVCRRRRRRHGAARDRARPRAGREAVVRERRHRSRVQPGRQFPRRVQRRRARRHRLLRRAVRRDQRRVA